MPGVGTEACASSHHWFRELQALGDGQHPDNCLYQDRKKISNAEDNEYHPDYRKLVKPVAHKSVSLSAFEGAMDHPSLDCDPGLPNMLEPVA